MPSNPEERRRQRSKHPHEALSLQLAHVRDEASLEALVLANEDGLLIAHAGDAQLCSELAALAPVVSVEGAVPANSNIGETWMQVRSVSWDGMPLYLASCSDSLADTISARMAAWLEHTQVGVTRILAG